MHVPLLQYKTSTHGTVTIQNMYTFHCHNTKHMHIPLLQYKTSTDGTVTIQNMYTHHYHNTKHVHVQLITANINAFFQDTDLLAYFVGKLLNFAFILF